MSRRIAGMLLSVATLMATALPFTVAYAQGTPVELKYATGAPPKTIWAIHAEEMTKVVEESSKGSLKINVYLNAQLGNEQDTVQQVARGRIDMGGFSITASSLVVPELALLNVPFLFANPKQQDCVLDQHLTKTVTDMMAAKGVHVLSWAEVGVADIIGKKPYLDPKELNGLKCRSRPRSHSSCGNSSAPIPTRSASRNGTPPSRPG